MWALNLGINAQSFYFSYSSRYYYYAVYQITITFICSEFVLILKIQEFTALALGIDIFAFTLTVPYILN